MGLRRSSWLMTALGLWLVACTTDEVGTGADGPDYGTVDADGALTLDAGAADGPVDAPVISDGPALVDRPIDAVARDAPLDVSPDLAPDLPPDLAPDLPPDSKPATSQP